jgi:hypothetical protein
MRMNVPVARRRLLASGVVLVLAAAFAVAPEAFAQSPSNTGLIHFRGGVDVPSLYVFRGIVQEGDPALTLTPWANLIVCTGDSERVCADTGIWSSLHTGSSGTGGPLDALHYSQQFHAQAALRLSPFFSVTPGYLANTSPNGGYETIQELDVQVASPATPFSPYVLLAFEFSDSGQLDGGSAKGSYLEAGATPALRFNADRWELSVPIKAGFSLHDYYELLGRDLQYVDHRFGFAQVGGRLTVPLTSGATRVGEWKVRGGADVFAFGDSTRAFNQNKRSKVVGTFGIMVTY